MKYSPQYSEREDTPPRLDKDLFQYLSNGEEFAYVWEEGFWTCYDLHEFDDRDPEVVEILRFSDTHLEYLSHGF